MSRDTALAQQDLYEPAKWTGQSGIFLIHPNLALVFLGADCVPIPLSGKSFKRLGVILDVSLELEV